MPTPNTIPAGHRRNAKGHLVPEELIERIDLDRDQLVSRLHELADEQRGALAAFRSLVREAVEQFVARSAADYGVEVGGQRGNITLTSYDGTHRVSVKIADQLSFDERLQAAKALVDQCIHRWTEGSNPEVRALVEHAFQVDKAGQISTSRVLGLTRLNIDDAEWRRAMEAIRDSITVTATKEHIQFHRRATSADKWQHLPIDLGGVS